MFDKAALFAALKPKTSPIEIDGFGILTIKQLSVAEVESAREKIKGGEKGESFGLTLLVMSVVNDDGVRVLSDDDIPAMKEAGNDAVDKLVAKALELNGFIKAAEQKN